VQTKEQQYDDFLREIYGETVKIGGYEYDTARAIKDVDPTAYRVGMNDWDAEQEEIDRTEKEVDGDA
jgi:hypothetical protein